MTKEIQNFNELILKRLNLQLSEITKDLECEEYLGFNFKVNAIDFKFRKSKLTPKKIGQFVTLWKRNQEGTTIPFDINDWFKFYIITIEENENSGFFIFPKVILEKHQILSNRSKEGKRGFRIYADWHLPENKQAQKTRNWQTDFFINYSDPEDIIIEKFKTITKFK